MGKISEKMGGITEVSVIPDGVPLYIEGGAVLRLRQAVLDLSDADGKDLGEVSTGSGLGGDFVQMEWKGRQATFYMRDTLKAWVATFDPEGAERIPATDLEVNYSEEAKS